MLGSLPTGLIVPSRSTAWIGALLGLVMLGFGACGEEPAPKADAPAPAADPMVGYDLRRLRPTDEALAPMFDRIAKSAWSEGKHVAVLFSADWCEPCQRLDLEFGNLHPTSMIGHVRILELKEDDWKAAARMDEYNDLRARWEPIAGTYPLLVLLDAQGKRIDEMKQATQRLEAAGLDTTLAMWFAGLV